MTMTLWRQGAADNPKTIETDERNLEGDSHLHLPDKFLLLDDRGRQPILAIQHLTHEEELLNYQFIPNQWGRLGKIKINVRATSAKDAGSKAYKSIMPVLCDLSYRYDVPLDVLQINIVEKATLTHTVEKTADFREAMLDEDPFQGGIDYDDFPLYSYFTYLYREGLNSYSTAYGFLCFYRIIEGIRTLRKARTAQGERIQYENEVIVGDLEEHFPEECRGKRFGFAIEKFLSPLRQKIAHAFIENKRLDLENLEELSGRLELEREYSADRGMAREIVRTMMSNEYWS